MSIFEEQLSLMNKKMDTINNRVFENMTSLKESVEKMKRNINGQDDGFK